MAGAPVGALYVRDVVGAIDLEIGALGVAVWPIILLVVVPLGSEPGAKPRLGMLVSPKPERGRPPPLAIRGWTGPPSCSPPAGIDETPGSRPNEPPKPCGAGGSGIDCSGCDPSLKSRTTGRS